ncbi:MAG: hypothetical protein HYU99_07875 [Deltaproteobacteria bacterium]|nr:hypothetical protein [Deltaproteobacteria bacterium]
MRINARVDRETAPMIRYLLKTGGLTISSLLKKSVRHYYRQVRLGESRAAKVLFKTGFVGCGRGSPGLSESYKGELPEIFGGKHGHR